MYEKIRTDFEHGTTTGNFVPNLYYLYTDEFGGFMKIEAAGESIQQMTQKVFATKSLNS